MESDQPRKKKGPTCPQCGNRLRVRADQVGMQVSCPKCNATFTVGRASDAAAARGPLTEDEMYEPEQPLDRSGSVPEELMTDLSPSANRQQGYDVDWSTADELEMEERHERKQADLPDYLTIAKERGLYRREERHSGPKWAFFSGVFGYPFRGVSLGRWVVLAAGFIVTGELFVLAVHYSASGEGLLMMPIISMAAATMLLLTMGFAAPCFLATVEDTADGFDLPQEGTMPELNQWFFSSLALVWVGMLAGVIGSPLSLVPEVGELAAPAATFLFFPVLVLSGLECESFLMPFSRPILASLVRQAGAWLVFYLLSGIVVGGWVALATYTLAFEPYAMTALLAAILAAVMLIYARLLGRLGWVITIAYRGDDGRGDEEEPSARRERDEAATRPTKRRRRRGPPPPDFEAGARLFLDDKKGPLERVSSRRQ